MGKKNTLIIALISTVLLTSGCTIPSTGGGGGQEIVCNEPYIRVGTECCLDQNGNKICDKDETQATSTGTQTQVETATSTGTQTGTQTTTCVGEGGTIPVIASPPECCPGLELIDPKDPEILGIHGICTADCGDGVCDDFTESYYNCPDDCVMEAEEVDPCGDGECGTGENQQNCCKDCGCEAGKYCSNNTCVKSPTFSLIPMMQVEMYSYCGDKLCTASENSSSECCTDCGCPTGHYCSNNTCVEGTAPLFMPMFIQMTAVFPTNEVMISDPEGGSVSPPHIYGNKVVFHQYLGSEAKTHMYDTMTKSLVVIPYPHESHYPDIWGGAIVWYDYARPVTDSSDIYYYNFAEGTQGYISPRPEYSTNPRIFNYAIVWEEQVTDGEEYYGRAYYMHWLPSGEERKFFHDREKDPNTGYEIWGANIVFDTYDWSYSPTRYELWKYDIATKETKRLTYTTSGEEIKSPSIWDKKVAYIVGNGGNAQVYVYDLSSALTQQITTKGSEKIGTAVYENKVVWADKRNGNWDIYMYDLSTSTEKQITSDEKDDWAPDIYDDKIVYIRGRYSNSPQDIYMYILS